MQEDDEESFFERVADDEHPNQSSPPRTNVTLAKSFVRFQTQRPRDSRSELPSTYREDSSSKSRAESPVSSKFREETDRRCRETPKVGPMREKRVYSSPKFVVSDCWKATSGEMPKSLVELFKEGDLSEDLGGRIKKGRLSSEDSSPSVEKLSHTKEFHVLTEVQKARILNTVEDVIKKVGNGEYCQEEQGRPPEAPVCEPEGSSIEKYYFQKFLLPWEVMKLLEIVVCHVIQITFLSNDSYFLRKSEFLPVVLTYYFTLFIVIFSLAMHIIFCSHIKKQHPCYFMCIMSSSILTLTTTLGILVMLCLMEYFRTFQEILVLVFIGALLCSLVGELCICYSEVKSFWNRLQNTEHYFIS